MGIFLENIIAKIRPKKQEKSSLFIIFNLLLFNCLDHIFGARSRPPGRPIGEDAHGGRFFSQLGDKKGHFQEGVKPTI
jgi:hypothetical protein